MAESRLVRCNDPDCGHEWESSASDPRCSDPDGICGRSRASPVESGSSTDSDSRDGVETDSDGTDSTDSADGSGSDGWSPIFETSDERTGAGTDAPSAPSIEDDQDDDDGESSESSSGPDHEIPELDAEDVRPFLVTMFGGPPTSDDEPIPGFLSQQRGDHWAMRDHELDQLSRAYARVGNKYLPYLLAEYTVEGLALLTTATVIAPRLQEDRRRAEREKKRATDTEANTGNVRSETSRSDSVDDVEEIDDRVEEELDQLAQADGDGGGWTAGANV